MESVIIAGKNSLSQIEEYVRKYSSLNLKGVANDLGPSARELANRSDIDLIFLDTETPGMDISDFIGSLARRPAIIIISENDKFALKAFDLNVVDYLLKPVNYPRFCKAADKALKFYSRQSTSKADEHEIFIKRGASLIKLKLNDIIFIEALENYIIINTSTEKFTIHFTMKGIENQLPSGIFSRIHRSYIINKSNILSIKENSLELMVGKTSRDLPVGKTWRDMLLKEINLMGQ